MEGKHTGLMDTRLDIYRHNARRVPAVAGRVIPERVFSRRDYEEGLLESIYRALAPLDPDGVLRHEWVNSRGSIARFDRFALEIRLVDVQEHAGADIAVAAAITAAVRSLTEEAWCSTASQYEWDERELAVLLEAGIRDADDAVIENKRFLECFGYPERGRARVRDLWQHLIETLLARSPATTRGKHRSPPFAIRAVWRAASRTRRARVPRARICSPSTAGSRIASPEVKRSRHDGRRRAPELRTWRQPGTATLSRTVRGPVRPARAHEPPRLRPGRPAHGTCAGSSFGRGPARDVDDTLTR
jgi:hypothetical protein